MNRFDKKIEKVLDGLFVELDVNVVKIFENGKHHLRVDNVDVINSIDVVWVKGIGVFEHYQMVTVVVVINLKIRVNNYKNSKEKLNSELTMVNLYVLRIIDGEDVKDLKNVTGLVVRIFGIDISEENDFRVNENFKVLINLFL